MCFGSKKDQDGTEQARPVKPFDEKLAAQRAQPVISDTGYQHHENEMPIKERVYKHFVAQSAPGSGGFVLDPNARISGMASWGTT